MLLTNWKALTRERRKLGNAPVITVSGFSRYPGVDPAVWDRFVKWSAEVYSPLMMRWPARKGIDIYQIVNESPLFPFLFIINHHENITTQQAAVKMPEMVDIYKDMTDWQKRRVPDRMITAGYQLVQSFRGVTPLPGEKTDTRIENAPFMHVEAYELFTENQEKYNQWFTEYGINVFVPLFMQQAGIKGYDYYRRTEFQLKSMNLLETEFPAYLSIIYFENSQAFETDDKSPELVAFNKTMHSIFPLGLNFRWYVQYQLLQSWRK
jgi:hypothetical protein